MSDSIIYDKKDLDTLFPTILPALRWQIRRRIPVEDVDDVTQDVCLHIVRGYANFKGESEFSTWLNSLVNHRIVDYYRRKATKDKYICQLVHDKRCTMPVFEEGLGIRDMLDRLPVRQSNAVFNHIYMGQDFHELAESMNLTYEGARSLYRRGKKQLRQLLEECG